MNSMVMKAAILLLIPIICSATEATQDGWQGGPGQPGPVETWNDQFGAGSDASWLSIPGQVSLASTPITPAVRHIVDDSFMGSFGIEIADIDGDGDNDLVGGAESSGAVILWVNDGQNPPTWDRQYIDEHLGGANAVVVADFDNDGRPDVAATAATNSQILVWYHNEGGDPIVWTEEIVDNSFPDAYEISASDVDGDGRLDILSGSIGQNAATWWRNEIGMPITWSRNDVDTAFAGAHSVRAGDFDGDGDNDLAGAASVDNQVALWRNEGGDPIVWTKTVLREDFIGARAVRFADLDRDGDLDLIGASWSSHLIWWRNEGGDPVQWTELIVDDIFFGGHCVEVADLNGDGLLDLMGAACTSARIIWYENGGGNPPTWTKHFVQSGYSCAVQVRPGDIDGDGDLDLVGSSWTLGSFDWWEITQFTQTGSLESSILDLGVGSAQLSWDAMVPPVSTFGVQVRSGEEPGNLGAWSQGYTSSGVLLQNLGRYFQYRLELGTAFPDYTPIAKSLTISSELTGVAGNKASGFGLNLDAWPNPFNPKVDIAFEITETGPAVLRLYDLGGSRVATLAEGRFGKGAHRVAWRGISDDGISLPSGIYLLHLNTPDGEATRKLTLLR